MSFPHRVWKSWKFEQTFSSQGKWPIWPYSGKVMGRKNVWESGCKGSFWHKKSARNFKPIVWNEIKKLLNKCGKNVRNKNAQDSMESRQISREVRKKPWHRIGNPAWASIVWACNSQQKFQQSKRPTVHPHSLVCHTPLPSPWGHWGKRRPTCHFASPVRNSSQWLTWPLRPNSVPFLFGSIHTGREQICTEMCMEFLWCYLWAVWTLPFTPTCSILCFRLLRGTMGVFGSVSDKWVHTLPTSCRQKERPKSAQNFSVIGAIFMASVVLTEMRMSSS